MINVENRLRQMERILEISRELASTTSPEQLLRDIVEAAGELIGTEASSILLFDEPSGELHFITSVHSTEQLANIPVPITQSIAGDCFTTGQPVIVPDVSQDPRYYAEVELQTGFKVRSLLAVPLQFRERRIGVLEVSNKRDNSDFDQEDVDILAALAAQATVTIENARLVKALQQHGDHLEHLVAARVADITRISAQLEMETVERQRAEEDLRYVIEAAEAASRTPGDILIVDDAPANLRLLMEILLERGHRVRAVRNGAHALAAAQAAPPDLILLDVVMPEMDGYEVCRHLKDDELTRDVPVLFISALDQTQDKLRAFAAGGVDYVTKPFQGAEVLARVQTHLSLRSLHKQLQAANAELISKLAELEARNQELDAFAHTVAHDIKNPLTLIVGYADLLEQDYGLLSKAERSAALRTLGQSAYGLVKVVDGLLLLAMIRKQDVALDSLDMDCILTNVLARLAGLIEKTQAEVILPPTWPEAWGYAPWIEEVWANYISNGCRYGGTPPRLELAAQHLANGQVWFGVRDYGPGISPADQARLFTPFTQFGQVRGEGYGLGLSIVQRIVDKLGGQVGVESDGLPGHGSLFFFSLPGASPDNDRSSSS